MYDNPEVSKVSDLNTVNSRLRSEQRKKSFEANRNLLSSDEDHNSSLDSSLNQNHSESKLNLELENSEYLDTESKLNLELEDTLLNLDSSKPKTSKSRDLIEFINNSNHKINDFEKQLNNKTDPSLQNAKEMPFNSKEKAASYNAATNEAERSRLIDECPVDKLTEYIQAIIDHESTLLEVKSKMQQRLNTLLLQQKLVMLGIDKSDKWAGFDKTLPVFSGESDKMDVNDFIFAVETNVEQLRKSNTYISDEQIAYGILNRLSNAPYNYYKKYIEECKRNNKTASWEEIKTLLKNVYNSTSKQLDLRSKLYELKALKSIHKYNDDFMKISSKIDNISEIELVEKYLNGLDQEIKSKIIMTNPTELNEVMSKAITYYNVFKSQAFNVSYAKPINFKPNRNNQRSQNNYQQNYQQNNQRLNSNYKGQAPRAPGAPPSYNQHMTRPQYQQRQQPNQRFNNQQRPNQQGKSCYKCGAQGHLKAQCPVKHSNAITDPVADHHNNYQSDEKAENQACAPQWCLTALTNNRGLAGTSALIDRKPIEVYFDTGAEVSILSLKTAQTFGFNLKQTKFSIKTANNEIAPALAETEMLSVNIADSFCELVFLVIDHDTHPVLLGLDWFNKVDASINPFRNTIYFNGRTVLLNTSTIIPNSILNTVEDDPEGRLDAFMDAEDNLDSIGYSPDDEVATVESKTEIELDGNDQEKFDQILAPIITERSTGSLGCYTGEQMVIEVSSKQPVQKKFYRRSQADIDELDEHVGKLLDKGIVEPSTSPYDSPAMLIKKKNGKKRLIHDYRAINLIILALSFPIPLVSYILDLLAGFMIFSTLDLQNGFFQCPLHPDSRKYTAFSTAKGHYQYTRCPQGIKTGPAWFSLCVDQAMRECRGFALNYFDDVVIYSKTVQDHFNHVRMVLETLKKHGFKIAPEKSTWFATKVSLLGYIVSGSKISINPDKIITIRDRPEPKNAKQVQQALGLFNFYRRFIDKFASKSRCLYELIKKEVKFNWSEECRDAYKYFVTCLTTEPAMAQPILGQPFIVYSDGSKFAIGGVLAQVINGIEHIIEYSSRLLKGAELNYGISDIECLACVFLIRKWHHYLYGTHFTLYTDHKALTQLMSIKDYVGRLGRQAMLLQEYTFTIKYLPGEENSAADIASRPAKYALVITRSKTNELVHEQTSRIINQIDPYDDLPFIYRLLHGKHLPGLAKKLIQRIESKINNYKIENNIISTKRDNKWKVIPFKEDRVKLIEQAHLLGHFAAETTYNRLADDYFWRNMIHQIELFIKKCIPCVRNKNFIPLEHPAKAIPVYAIFDRIGMDVTGNFPASKDGFIKLLVIKEYLTKLVRIYPLRTKTAEEIAANLWRWITTYGPPKEVLSDQGSEFVNSVVSKLLNRLGIERRVTSSFAPRTDGLVEKANDTIVSVLRTHAESDHQNWLEWIPFVEYAYNTRIHTTTKFAPLELFTGVRPNAFIDYRSFIRPLDDEFRDLMNRSSQLNYLISNNRPLAIENIKMAQEVQMKIQNQRVNVTTTPLTPGTPVMIKNDGIHGKLEPKYRGRYYVVEQTTGGNYRLKYSTGEVVKETYPINKLKPFLEDEQIENVEIEKIIQKRTINNEPQYLVKWKNFDSSHNEWLAESKFDDMALINKFNNSFYPIIQNESTRPLEQPIRNARKAKEVALKNISTGRGRAARVLATPQITVILLIIILQIICIAGQNPNRMWINSKFSYCDKSTANMIDFDTNCQSRPQTATKKFPELTQKSERYMKLSVLFKRKSSVFGSGFECKVSELQTILKSDFLSRILPPIKTSINLDIEPAHCWNLINSKSCVEGEKMNCQSTGCFSPDPDYSKQYTWWTEKVVISKKCSFRQLEIVSNEERLGLFGRNCYAIDGYCKLVDSIVVWDPKEIIHNCPFEIVGNSMFELLGESVFYSNTSNLAFEIISKEAVCDPPVNVYKTTEGLYLMKWIIHHDQIKMQETQTVVQPNMLLLSEIDNTRMQEVRLYRELNLRNCYSILNSIYLMSKLFNDKHYVIKDINGNNLIIYIQNQNAYIPNCMQINRAGIVTDASACTEGIPAEITVDNKTFVMYLYQDRIITLDTTIMQCRSENYKLKIVLENATILNRFYDSKEKKTVIALEPYLNLHHHINIINNNLTEINFRHLGKIIEDVDYNRMETTGLVHEDGRFFQPNQFHDTYESLSSKFKGFVQYIHSNWFNIKVAIITLGIIIAIIIFSAFVKCIYKTCKFKRNKHKELKPKSVNMIKGFLPSRSESTKNVNYAAARRHSTDSLDPVTVKLFERLEKENMEILRLAKF